MTEEEFEISGNIIRAMVIEIIQIATIKALPNSTEEEIAQRLGLLKEIFFKEKESVIDKIDKIAEGAI